MAERVTATAQTEEWKRLVCCLPGVLNAEFAVENGQICEVHILSSQSRAPKQIVRDVQSAMAAKFQIDLDHRIISVAQIPSAPEVMKKRLLCEEVTVSSGREGTRISVVLSINGTQHAGEAMADGSVEERHRSIARAAVSAINSVLVPSVNFSVSDVRVTHLGNERTVLVGLRLRFGNRTEQLLGACYEGDDANISIVMATLDAVNRRIMTLSFS